ncbi:hypothetical protein HPB51_029641 [Rhipicephalus microplus]|uniref:Uncharacterized protein n=1 Tax=Rhipicephalus microplus TaxID=6941 RepID=A0A9J6CU40_RHIMP|nr:hypothetical protein HPB51_029641 [Rhipicephalus microplus]
MPVIHLFRQSSFRRTVRNVKPHLLFAGGAPEPFLGFLLSDRHPIESPQPCMAEETSVLCPICRIPELSRRAHHFTLHHSRLFSVAIRHAIPRAAQPPPVSTTVEAVVALLRSARPDLQAKGALSTREM